MTNAASAFDLEEHLSSNLLSSTHYYRLAGHLLGELTGSGTLSTNFLMTTALGSVLAVISNTANSATLRSTQLYAPYGSRLFQDQSLSAYTTKGFTGQYNDPTSGLDYYVSRYYDPVASVFLSADTVLGNGVGLNPYGYVSNNPETYTDPTGQMVVPPGGGGSGGSGGGGSGGSGGEGRGNPFWPPPGGAPQGNPGGDTSTNSGACQMLGCKHVVNLDSGSVWVWVSTGGSGPSSVSGGTSCGLMDMGGFAGLTCSFTPGSSSGGYTGGGYWVRLNRSPTQTVVCTYNCSDEPTGSSEEEGQSKAEFFPWDGSSSEGAGGSKESFPNRLSGQLQSDLSLGKEMGVEPIQAKDPGFQSLIQKGTVKWAISEDGQLLFVPKYVGGTEIPHTVITGGNPVLSAGEASIINTGNGYTAIDFNLWSGHYWPDDASSVLAIETFIESGINIPSPI
jgi:RHS repeat-associated protein